ncbi:uncharacterized protein LOC123318365 [Coccinella septempunctata]|uniref:uncharacterized protein LOC123318365 n=1 Tax=Coccinella septempunctata TaxID=41139 RepID=UPI001D06E727|nr:uncharacterized protein LOC123318365 [Coccinella septempunctata]
MVRLPFKTENPSGLEVPGSFEFARRMLLSLENKFESNFDFRRLYIDFMVDYVKSGHMREVKLNEVEKVKYFLPHHGVLKNVGNNLKLRTVFNGSARALNGLSLNDTLNSGANLLPDLSSLILRWLKYPLVFVTDVKQMFRQIRVHSEDQFYQAILWRFDPSEEIKIWLLETVTYGLICSPYLAIRVTRKLAEDEYHNFPLGAEILNREVYMDDATSGGYTLEEALRKQIELINICKVGGFELHKWVANDVRLLKDLSVPHAEDDTGLSFSVLGLKWNAGADYFHFDIQTPPIIYDEIFITKRFVLSKIAKLFDPLGWIAPVIINFKIFIQKLWLNKFDWDEELPSDLAKQFIECFNDLGCISEVKIDRWLGYKPGALSYEIHGFADASKVAYGAVVYLRVIYDNQVNVHLLQAKTKVAPLKPLLTIPRLELSAAVLLVKLVRKVCDAIAIENCTVNLWSDSTDVLFWLRDHPSRWPTFIANRCSIVHTVMPSAVWRHVSSSVNPADCASRGLKASDLCDFELWWKGPKFLRESFEPFQIPINSDPTSDSAIEVNCLVHSGEQEGKHGVWNLVVGYSEIFIEPWPQNRPSSTQWYNTSEQKSTSRKLIVRTTNHQHSGGEIIVRYGVSRTKLPAIIAVSPEAEEKEERRNLYEANSHDIDESINQYDANDSYYDDYSNMSNYASDQYEVTPQFCNDNQYSDLPDENFQSLSTHQDQT